MSTGKILNSVTTAEVIEIMLGKTLTYCEMRQLFARKYPDRDMPPRELSPKFRSVVRSLMRSPHADIEQILARENKYHLRRISPDFYQAGGARRTKKCKISLDSRAVPKVRPQMSPEDAECCRMAAIFNQLLMPVRQMYTTQENRT